MEFTYEPFPPKPSHDSGHATQLRESSQPAHTQNLIASEKIQEESEKLQELIGLFTKASNLYEQDRYDDAIRVWDQLIEKDPINSVSLNNRGITKAKKGDYEGAIKDFNEAIRLKPDSVMTLNNRGNAKSKKRDYDGAVKDFDEAVRLKPKDAVTWYNRGVTKYEKKDYDAAIEAIRLRPDYADAFYYRGLAKAEKGDKDGLIDDCHEAYMLKPREPREYFVLAYLCADMKKKLKMLANIEKALKLDPSRKKDLGKNPCFKEYWEDEDFKRLTE